MGFAASTDGGGTLDGLGSINRGETEMAKIDDESGIKAPLLEGQNNVSATPSDDDNFQRIASVNNVSTVEKSEPPYPYANCFLFY